jgi:hypothetical protein
VPRKGGFLVMLRHAFKEWATICRLFAEGRQAVILRKGGIAERNGGFQVEHKRFWLYPTYVHQQRGGMRPEFAVLLEEVEAKKPPDGVLRLAHFAETERVCHVTDLQTALALQDLHGWSEETIRQRFAYRTPGLFVLAVRVWKAVEPQELPEVPKYAGCKSWVELERELPISGATPALTDAAFQQVLGTLEAKLAGQPHSHSAGERVGR